MAVELTKLVSIPGGDFLMGDDEGNSNERPRICVTVKPFRLEIHPVTNSQFKRFLEENPSWQRENVGRDLAEEMYLNLWKGSDYPDGLGDYAVINVSWHAAKAYAEWAGRRLATEAEWEFAGGGPEHFRFALGDAFQPDDYVFALEHDPIGFQVCQNPANGFGLYDMCGGVWEWTWDMYEVDAYLRLDPRHPVNNTPSDQRTIRGGASTFSDERYLRCSVRGKNLPTAAHEDYGIRCAADE